MVTLYFCSLSICIGRFDRLIETILISNNIHPFGTVTSHSFIHSFMHSFVRSSVRPFVHSFIHSFIFMHSFIHSFICLFVHSSVHSFIHSFIHSLLVIYHSLVKTTQSHICLCVCALVFLSIFSIQEAINYGHNV